MQIKQFITITITTTSTTTIIDALGRWSQEMDTTMWSTSKEVLKRMQKAVVSGMLNMDF